MLQGPLDDLVLFAGDTAIMECPVESLALEPGYQVTWSRSISTLPINRVNFTCDNQTLILRDVICPDDIDSYMCEIQEPSGRRFRYSIFLRIFGKYPSPFCFFYSPDTYGVRICFLGAEPAVIERMCAAVPMVMGLVGSDVELLCPTMSNSATRVWRRGGGVLSTGGRLSVLERGRRLVISMLQEADAGIYNCTVSDQRDMVQLSDSVGIELVVNSKYVLWVFMGNVNPLIHSDMQAPLSFPGFL